MVTKPPYEITSHTADIGLVIRGTDMAELLVNGGYALNAIQFEQPPLGRDISREIRVESTGTDTLLVDWLNELLYMFVGEGLVFSRFKAMDVSGASAVLLCEGEQYDPSRHAVVRDIKAATYHMAGVRCTDEGYEARVILDV